MCDRKIKYSETRFEINLSCVENTHRDCIYNKENVD